MGNSGVAAIVLAAGLSSRMAPRNKLLLRDAAGVAMIAHVVDAALASRAAPVLVVTGHQEDLVRHELADRDVLFVTASDYAEGMAASLRAGIAALPGDASAALVCLGDMPLVTAAVMDRVIGAYDPAAGRLIVVPTFRGQRGNPVLWGRRFFAEIMALRGDSGARALLAAHAGDVTFEEMADEGVLRDFDEPGTWTEIGDTGWAD